MDKININHIFHHAMQKDFGLWFVLSNSFHRIILSLLIQLDTGKVQSTGVWLQNFSWSLRANLDHH